MTKVDQLLECLRPHNPQKVTVPGSHARDVMDVHRDLIWQLSKGLESGQGKISTD